MFRTTTAPDVTGMVTASIRGHRRYLASGERRATEGYTEKEIVGRFIAVADAVVEVELHITFSKRRGKGVSRRTDEHTVQFTALAQCAGHGCADPKHEVPATDMFLVNANTAETSQAALPLATAARAWAQKARRDLPGAPVQRLLTRPAVDRAHAAHRAGCTVCQAGTACAIDARLEEDLARLQAAHLNRLRNPADCGGVPPT